LGKQRLPRNTLTPAVREDIDRGIPACDLTARGGLAKGGERGPLQGHAGVSSSHGKQVE